MPSGMSEVSVFPAYAGMFRSLRLRRRILSRFPRIRGDVPSRNPARSTSQSFSPHTRGCSRLVMFAPTGVTVFPAYAGMFPNFRFRYRWRPGFPRIRGDVPEKWWKDKTKDGFSPHTRGCSAREQIIHVGFPRFPRIRGDIPEARPAMRKILLKKFSQQGSLLSFQTFHSSDHIKSAPTFTKPKVDFLCPNYKIPALC